MADLFPPKILSYILIAALVSFKKPNKKIKQLLSREFPSFQ